jgi:hypothetical protein
LKDSNPQVRLMALLALAEMPPDSGAGLAVAELFRDETVIH